MIVELNYPNHEAIATKEKKDKSIYSDSILFHYIKLTLQSYGHKCVKKLMVKDGHMVAEGVYYVREKKGKWAIWDSDYAIRLAYKDYNEGKVSLRFEG